MDTTELDAPVELVDELPGRTRSVHRLRGLVIAICIAFTAVVFFGLLTRGAFTTGARVGLDPFYEGQARALLDGRLDVTPPEVDGEAIIIDGKYYGYFGVVPAVLRAPVMVFYPTGWPNLGPWYFMAAFGLASAATVGMVRWARRRIRERSRWSPLYEAAFVLSVLGSASLQLAVRPYKYEEAILWGVAFGISAFWSTLLLHETDRLRYAILAALATIGAWGSRPPIGAGASVALGLMALILWRRSFRVAVVAGAGAVIAPMMFSLVNYLKFQTLFSTPYEHHVAYMNDPRRLALAHAGPISYRYLPTNLVQYLRPDTLHFASEFPWVTFRMPGYAPVWNIGNVTFDGIFPTASVTSTMPLLVILSVVGLIVCARRFRAGLTLFAGGIAASLLTLSFWGEVQRYMADFVPFLTVGAAFGLLAVLPKRGRDTAGVAVICLVLALSALWVNFALGFDAQQGTVI